MEIERVSPMTGKTNVMDINVTEDQMYAWTSGQKLIQNAMPHLTDDEREFIMSGYTAEDWEKMFPKGDE